MRKKTIKSYFINNSVKNPATGTIFCFSKRSFKQIKQQKKTTQWIKNSRKSKKTMELIRYYVNYKNKVRTQIYLNQWTKTNENLSYFFLKSYYLNKKILSKFYKKNKHANKQLKLWFLFKNAFLKTLKKRLYKYPKTGVLSSHYVHILSRKNITYQTRSKYRSKTSGLNFFNHYFYFCTKFLYTYVYALNSSVNYFSTNPVHKNIWVDEDFHTHTSDWQTNALSLKKKNYVNITRRYNSYNLFNVNVLSQNNDLILSLYKNKLLITSFYLEEDQIKKDAIYADLVQIMTNETILYMHLINMFITSTYINSYKNNLTKILLVYINKYSYFSKIS